MFPFNKLTVDVYGASHADAIGVKLGGLPDGLPVDVKKIQAFLDTRKAGQNPWSTPRKEADEAIFLSGIVDGKTSGAIEARIENKAQRSGDYDAYKNTPRPSHADYVATVKDGKAVDLAGGGRFSGRMTAPLCIAGGIALQILEQNGVTLGAYVTEIGGVRGKSYDDGDVTPEEIGKANENGDFALTNTAEMTEKVLEARASGDSVGGSVECIAFGLPVGVGDALFDGLEGRIAAAVYAVPAVKAVEFGLGTGFADKKGSEANDPFAFKDGKVVTLTNHNGGINGGISNGMPLALRVTIKPTPSISLPQKTVDLATGKDTVVEILGRHDACIVPRAVAGVKAAVALALLDVFLEENRI